jgi:hypothetical protein
MPAGWINQVEFGFFVGFGLGAGLALFNGIMSLFGRGARSLANHAGVDRSR